MGEEAASVSLFDSRAPIPANAPDDGDDATLLSWFARDLAVPYGKVLSIPPEELRAQDPDEMFAHVLERARQLQVLPADTDTDTLRAYFEVYIANGIALQLYAPQAYHGDLVLFRAEDEPADYGPTLGWDSLCSGRLQIRPVPGDHNSIMYAPNVGTIASGLATTKDHLTTGVRA
jgi:thioesterase domain-containing protein